MNLLQHRFKRLREQEAIEPLLTWGFRMGIAVIVPLMAGHAFGLKAPMDWVALTAETICWVELKGSVKQRVQVLTAGALLATLFTALGSLTAGSFALSLVAMLATGFVAGLFKNLGDRGSGLSICVGAMFIISNALPAWGGKDLLQRLGLTLLAGAWCIAVELVLSLRNSPNEAFRRSIARIWQEITALSQTVTAGWTAGRVRRSSREIYSKETAVRQALDASMVFHQTLSDTVTDTSHRDYNLIMVRKATALVATHITALGEAIEGMRMALLPPDIRVLLGELGTTFNLAANRMSHFIMNLEGEESLLLEARLARLEALSKALAEAVEKAPLDIQLQKRFARTVHLTSRSAGLMRHLITLLPRRQGEPRAYHSYSLMKTIYALHPGFMMQAVRTLFQFKTENFRYALRLAGALVVAGAFSKYLHWNLATRNAYWLPFTVLLIVQPYIGATMRKSLDRIMGTLTGGIAAGVLLFLPTTLFLKETMLFLSSVLMIYYLKKNYAVSAFFITVSLVLLLAVEESASAEKILLRGLSTVAGAAIAIGSGFLLLPTWDRRKLPLHLAGAYEKNYAYLCFTLRTTGGTRRQWLQHKRAAEQANSRAFESFQRYLREPDVRHKIFMTPYQVLTHNMRLTRQLNQLQLEREVGNAGTALPAEQAPPAIRETGEKLRTLSAQVLQAYKERGLLAEEACAELLNPDSPLDIRTTEEELLEKMAGELQSLLHSVPQRIT